VWSGVEHDLSENLVTKLHMKIEKLRKDEKAWQNLLLRRKKRVNKED